MEQTVFDALIQAITNSDCSVTKACEAQGATRGAFYYAIAKDPSRRIQYARALECRVEGFAEQTVEIADTEADPQKARNKIQARQWYAGKIAPKRFGERLDMTVTNTGNPAELHDEGMRRARLMRDPEALANAQAIEELELLPASATDGQSVPPAKPSIFD